jgi:SAM-dependent methyltransferase
VSRGSWLPGVIAVGIGLNTVRLRRRLGALAVIEPSDEPAHPAHVVLVAEGVRLDDAALRAASAHAVRHGLDVLDIVPGQLTPDRLLDLARRVDTHTYPGNRRALGVGVYQAVLVSRDLLERSGVQYKDLTETDLVDLLVTLKRYAPTTTGLAVLPGLADAARSGHQRFITQRAVYRWLPLLHVAPVARDVAILASMPVTPGTALAALAASSLQPLVVGAGRVRQRPGDLLAAPWARRRAVGELVADVVSGARARVGDDRGPAGSDGDAAPAAWDLRRPDSSEPGGVARWRVRLPAVYRTGNDGWDAEIRRGYEAELAAGVERFLEKQRTTCPWCGGTALRRIAGGADIGQRKPGRFRYDRCRDCRHVFQNPRLTAAGLDFYYRDFYDGLGGPFWELVWGVDWSKGPADRARMVPRAPRTWLDVGTGLGHFPLFAREIWPDTVFDGLDMGAGVEMAERRRWIDRAYRGQFTEFAPRLTGQYDVVSMFHYLEHPVDPLAQLDAAATVLAPGGYLVIEVPNPDSPLITWYRSLTPSMLVPQHLNLFPAENLAAAIAERGLRVERTEFCHVGGDAPYALWAIGRLLAPPTGLPWRADPPVARLRRAMTVAGLAPLVPAALAVEAVTTPYLRRGRRATNYRILARKP